MARANGNRAWNLESFLDSMIVELDKAQDTLAVKGITRKLTYTVKDIGLDLQIFPQFDGSEVRFTTAQPGQEGASKISIQLGSITDRQIHDHTAAPLSREDIDIEEIEGIDDDTKKSLHRLGIKSASDMERVERRNVDVEGALKRKVKKDSGTAKTDYGKLAGLIKRARRGRTEPLVNNVGLSEASGRRELALKGENLVVPDTAPANGVFPVATLNDHPLPVIAGDERSLRLDLSDPDVLTRGMNHLQVALDPYTLIRLDLEA